MSGRHRSLSLTPIDLVSSKPWPPSASGDALIVPKLDRLARSVPDARAIGDSLAAVGLRLSMGGTVYDPTDQVGKMFFNILATFAEFEVDLLRMRTREGMAIARANGKLKGKQPRLSPRQRVQVLKPVQAADDTIAELAELFAVSRATICREIARAGPAAQRPLIDRPADAPGLRRGRPVQAPRASQMSNPERTTYACHTNALSAASPA